MFRLYHFLLIFLLAFASFQAFGQAKIGDNKTSIQAGSLMELESTNKGFLNVRLNTTQMLSIPVSAASRGMMIYNVDSVCLCLYNGTAWRNMCKFQSYQKKIVYIANAGDSVFLCPEIVYDENNVQVFRNGVQINFNANLGTKIVKIELEAICRKDDEIKIVQIINQ